MPEPIIDAPDKPDDTPTPDTTFDPSPPDPPDTPDTPSVATPSVATMVDTTPFSSTPLGGTGGFQRDEDSLPSLAMPSPKQQQEYLDKKAALLNAQIEDEEKYERDRAQYYNKYSSNADKLLRAESWTGDEKPWDPNTMAPPPTNLWEKFGSPGFIFAMLAGNFSAMPMQSALFGGAAAINAINQGDMDAYEKAYQAWKDNTNLAIKRHDQEHREFEDTMKIWDTKNTLAREQLEAQFHKYGDKGKLALLNAGYDSELIDAAYAQAKAKADIVKMQAEMDEQHAQIIGTHRYMKAGEPADKAFLHYLKDKSEAKAAIKPLGLTQIEAQQVEHRATEILADAQAKGEPMDQGTAEHLALQELYKTKQDVKPQTKPLREETEILGRATEIEEEAKAKGEVIPHWKALQQAEIEHKNASSLEQTPDGDVKPPPGQSQATWDMNSDVYRATGHLPTLGIGGTQLKQGLYAHAMYREQQKGGSIGTMQARWATNQGLSKALSQAEVNDAAVTAFARNAELNSAVLIDLAKKVDKSGVRVIERWRRAGGRAIAGDPDVTNFDAQVNIWRQEIAKLTTSQNLGGQLPVHAQQEAEKYAGVDWTLEQIKGTVNLLKGDGQRRKQAIGEEIATLQNQIATSLDTNPGANPPNIPPVDTGDRPKIKSFEQVQ